MNREYGIQIQITGYKFMNRALSGDVVAVKLLKQAGSFNISHPSNYFVRMAAINIVCRVYLKQG